MAHPFRMEPSSTAAWVELPVRLPLRTSTNAWHLCCPSRRSPACPAADVLMPDEEIGRAVVHVRDLDISPDAPPADLWLPLQQPVTQRRRRREAKQRAKEQRSRRKSRGGGTSDGGSSRGCMPGHARRADGAASGDAGLADQGSASSDSEGSEDTQGDDVCVLSRWVGGE